ncbi:S-layer homology domain-containing protein [Paenibacillus sp. 481]|nr:S-layer homology domain-containing protein [Paenibacillus sp. 481]
MFIVLALSLTSVPLSVYADKFAMSYIYFGDSSKFVQAVDQTQGSLDMISPSYFDLNKDGSLLLTPALDPAFIKEMHRRKMKVVPFLSNHWDRQVGISALHNKHALVKQVADAVEKYDLDGVNVNIENLTPKERDEQTALVRMLRQAIPAHKEVSVAVAANPNEWKTGWHGSYDYAGLAKVSDYLMVMTYDESYQGGPAGPIASLPFVEKSIQVMLKDVPSHKIVMGIPFFGRYWKSDGTMKGYAIQHNRVEPLVKQYGGMITYDERAQSPKATFTIDVGDPLVSVHNKKLNPGTYTVWYDNKESIKAKLSLVNKYNLKGAGNWSLNEDSREIWNHYSAWLNGTEFIDTPGHWAAAYISSAQQKGWMSGTSPKMFEPNKALTRAQAASILVRVKNTNHGQQRYSTLSPYWDVPSHHWAAADIRIAQQAGLISGFSDGSFVPNRAVTREELAMMIARLLPDLPQATSPAFKAFKDVSPYRWSTAAIMELTNRGIIQGYKDNTFRPLNKVTRAEMAAMLYAYSVSTSSQ